MNCEQIAELLPDYLQESLNREQRNLVESHLQGCDQCREEIALWQKLALLPEEQPGPELRARFKAMLNAYQEGRGEQRQPVQERPSLLRGFLSGGWLRMPAAGLAWAVLLLVVGFVAGRSVNSPNPADTQMAKLQSELADMHRLVTISLLQQQSASERLQAIAQATAWSMSEQHADPKVLAALMHTLHSDNSVDVRLAAVDALGRYHSQPEVRKGLVEALQTQQSPLVQVALIDLMVDLKDSSVVEQLRKFEQDPSVNPTVRQCAQWGIRQLT
ncbi:MAG TPA: HEAT repeat domain-containing protein [Candidatus Angelobacter sp.]